jgi:hypothetical protein
MASILAAGPAFAANAISVVRIGPNNVELNYSCDPRAGVVAIKVMVGAPDADSPSARGVQDNVNCNGGQQDAVVGLVGTVSKGQVLVNAALVTSDDTVVKGQKWKATVG